jgi:diacylglycerol kinase family enzyme
VGFNGTLHRARGVTTMKVREVHVLAEAPMLFHVDGEAVPGAASLTVRVHPRALRVRA